MRYTEQEKKRIGLEFLDYMKRIGYGRITNLEIADGVPVDFERAVQKFKPGIGIASHPGDTTMEPEA